MTAQLATAVHGAALALLVLAGPGLAVSVAVGLVVSVAETLFGIQEQSVGFAAKLAVLIGVLTATGGWAMHWTATWAHGLIAGLSGL